MMQDLTISQVADKTGLSTKTIRFYETSGVVAHIARSENGYRLYTERDIQRLMLVKRARDLGLPLEEIRNIVSLCIDKGCVEARDHVVKYIPSYIQQIETKIQELSALKQQFEYIQNNYEQTGSAWHHKTDDCFEILPIMEG